MKKYLFFDVDGTLYNSNKEIPSSTLKAIEQAKKNGHEIGIATGRAPFMIKDLLETLDIHTYVCFNGQYVVMQDEVIFTDGIPNEQLEEILLFAEQRNEPIAYFNDEVMIASHSGNENVAVSLATLKYPYPIVERKFYENNSVYQTLIFVNEEEEKAYRERFPQLQIVRWHSVSCDLLPKDGSKARGLQKLIESKNIPIENVFVFGDGLNDVEMLRYIPNSVAMGNGHEQAKEAAKMVTRHVDDDGILHALQTLQLI
jgi:Cof subfamily protein (haloacid dehalogenase superfamily)